MTARLLAFACSFLLWSALSAHAQALRVTAERTNLRDKPATDGAIVGSLVKGDELTVLERAGTWYRVRTASGQEGFVSSLLVEATGPAATPPAAPPPAPAASAASPRPAAPPAPARTSERPVTEAPADQGGGSASASRRGGRGWIDLNAGIATAAETSYSTVFETTIFDEPASFSADYEFPRGGSVDIGAGYLVTEWFGVGVSAAATSHSAPGVVTATIPHPRFFNAPATGTADTANPLDRNETAFHFQAVAALPISDRARLRLFAGPSFFRVTQDVVDDIRFDQVAGFLTPANTVTVTGTDILESEASAWGFHLGGDLSYFLTEHFGIGGFARFSRATIEQAALVGGTIETKAGGFQAGGGLRVKF